MSGEDSKEMVARRNKRLLQLFTNNGYDVRIVGDSLRPSVVLNEMVVLSCQVRNFDLHFTKEPFSDEIVKSFNLKGDIEDAKLELQEAIELGAHRPVYKVKLIGTDMFLVGFNYIDPETPKGKYPVFAKHKPRLYFDKDYADRLVESLKEENYFAEVDYFQN